MELKDQVEGGAIGVTEIPAVQPSADNIGGLRPSSTSSDYRFKRVAVGLQVQGLLDRVTAQPELWGQITDRQTTPGSPHHDTECIFLRWAEGRSIEDAFYALPAIDYPAAVAVSPEAGDVVVALLHAIGNPHLSGPIGRVIIAKLKPGGHIDAHMDEGTYAEFYDRFHVCLSSAPGNEFTVDGESFEAQPGEAWWFNHKRVHEVWNHSAADRIHLIVDVVAPAYRAMRGLYVQRERSIELWDEIMPLLIAHKEEIAHYPDIALDPDVEAYNAAEANGALRCYTVRLEGVLIGYAVFFVRRNLHYKASLQAVQDVLFVLPQFRKGRVGYRLIRHTERALQAEGVQVDYQHVKAGERIRKALADLTDREDVGMLMELMRYELVDLIYAKRLDRKEA